MRNSPDDRHDAADLLVGRDRLRPGARRFAADVDHVGAALRHCVCLSDGGVEGGEAAAIRKTIGRDIEHAHDKGAARG